jgi:hypothetical protein
MKMKSRTLFHKVTMIRRMILRIRSVLLIWLIIYFAHKSAGDQKDSWDMMLSNSEADYLAMSEVVK